jgi:hypothetical protein
VLQLLAIALIAEDHIMAGSGKYGSEFAAHQSRAKNADTHVHSVSCNEDLNGLRDSTFHENTFLVIDCVLHVFVKERENFFRMPSEVIVTILEAPGRALNPNQFLLLAPQQIEGLLCVLGILGHKIDLDRVVVALWFPKMPRETCTAPALWA